MPVVIIIIIIMQTNQIFFTIPRFWTQVYWANSPISFALQLLEECCWMHWMLELLYLKINLNLNLNKQLLSTMILKNNEIQTDKWVKIYNTTIDVKENRLTFGYRKS